jgi:hypothetical protein
MFTRSLVSLISLALATSAFAQTATTFTYQGELRDGGLPANGSYDVRFRLFDGLASPTQLGSQLCVDNIAVVDGRFAVTLDFGFQFSSPGRALELEVRSGATGDCSNAGGFVILAPRQTITSVPAATFSSTSVLATNATLLNNQPASFYSSATNIAAGTLADARLSTNVPRLNAASTAFTGTVAAPTFTGALNGNAATATNATQLNGQSALFYQNAANLNSGLLADARLSPNIPRLDASNIFLGSSNTFQGTLNARSLVSITNPTNALAAAQVLWSSDVPTLRISGSGVGSANGLQFSTPGAPTAMRILDTGDIGIGTTAPEAPLHVRGGGSMGGIIITPDVTDTQSQLVLSENTTASNAMLMRYNGTTNNIEFRGRAADVESAAHMTINRDSGALIVTPATATGDASVQLPDDSVSASEMLDEAGLSSLTNTAAVTLALQTTVTVDTITINTPRAGRVVVMATLTYRNPDFRDQEVRTIIATSPTAGASAGYPCQLRGDDIATSEAGDFPEFVTLHKTFSVGAGANTLYLRAFTTNNAPVAFAPPVADDIVLTAIFVPTTY